MYYSSHNIPTVDLSFLGFPNYSIYQDSSIWSDYTSNYMHQSIDSHGYMRVQLRDMLGINHRLLVHRLVASAYIPINDYSKEVNHIDGCKINNWFLNLEWVTPLENTKHAMQIGLTFTTVGTDEVCHEICRLLEEGISQIDISNKLNIPYTTISAIYRRKNWKHISRNYVFPTIRRRSEVIPETTISQAKALKENGMSLKDIAISLNISYIALKKRINKSY